MNIGEKGGLWAILKAELEKHRDNLPFIKLWCAAHRSDLAWKDMADSVKEVRQIMNEMTSIASYFRTSSLRTDELKQIATERDLTLLLIPKLFEVRWTEWTYKCVKSILRSWNALVIYFEKNKHNAVAAGFFNFLTNYDKLKQIVFLADVLRIFQHYHKNVQSDNLTIVTLKMHITSLTKEIISLRDGAQLMGGWEERLVDMVSESEEETTLKGIELATTNRTRGMKKRQSQEIRSDIIETLLRYMDVRFKIDEEITRYVEPFIKCSASADDIRNVHKIFAPDLSLSTLNLQYNSVVHMQLWTNEPLSKKIKDLVTHEDSSTFDHVSTVFCRIQSCTPQSADVERCVKMNNLLKTSSRSSLSLETENRYLFINYNMPPLKNWNPRKAILFWMREKERRSHQDLLKKETALKQSWYEGVFDNTEEDEDEIKESYSLESKRNDKNF